MNFKTISKNFEKQMLRTIRYRIEDRFLHEWEQTNDEWCEAIERIVKTVPFTKEWDELLSECDKHRTRSETIRMCKQAVIDEIRMQEIEFDND